MEAALARETPTRTYSHSNAYRAVDVSCEPNAYYFVESVFN